MIPRRISELFKASLVYQASSGIARAVVTGRNSVSKKKTKKQKQKGEKGLFQLTV